MFQLTVLTPSLNDFSVFLVKSTQQSYSVVCGLWPAVGGLPTIVDIGINLYAYASTYMGELQDGITISPNDLSSPLSKGNVYNFNGITFLSAGRTPADFDYGLCNGRPTSLTCGLCQDVTINGQAAKPPVCVQRLLPDITVYFPANDRFWLGIGQLSALGEPEPGLLISTSLLEAHPMMLAVPSPPETALGRFALVDFSSSTSLVATYQQTTSSFHIGPS